MSNDTQDITKLSPHKLMVPFAESKIWKYVIIAVVVHIVLVLVTSIGYLHQEFAKKQPATSKTKQAQPQKTAATVPAQPTKQPAAAASNTGAAKQLTPAEQHQALIEQNKDKKVIKDITSLPKKGEIPKEPDDLGISIQDTNIQ